MRSNCSLKDEFDNRYKVIEFGITSTPVGAVNSESIYPETKIIDIIVFEKPIKKAKQLRLELDGSNLSIRDQFKFIMPQSFDVASYGQQNEQKEDPTAKEKPKIKSPEELLQDKEVALAKVKADAAEDDRQSKLEERRSMEAAEMKKRKEDEAKKKYEDSLRTISVPTGEKVVIGISLLVLKEGAKNNELRLKYLSQKAMIELFDDASVSLVSEKDGYSVVVINKKKYYVPSKYLKPEKR